MRHELEGVADYWHGCLAPLGTWAPRERAPDGTDNVAGSEGDVWHFKCSDERVNGLGCDVIGYQRENCTDTLFESATYWKAKNKKHFWVLDESSKK